TAATGAVAGGSGCPAPWWTTARRVTAGGPAGKALRAASRTLGSTAITTSSRTRIRLTTAPQVGDELLGVLQPIQLLHQRQPSEAPPLRESMRLPAGLPLPLIRGPSHEPRTPESARIRGSRCPGGPGDAPPCA